ncbi:LytR C-terminal domain-containing protein [Amycolatopsis sp. CA-230715]|uniref:LytR C-terminal domain-containing protein n=1 Tax=Amycolatopsis sp. CA-230715 TaxID=2745196 RepID=UPI001C0203DC|nr:LytR C-terminal domain-containing protein [Amycolatopsis sp. CA-230715]QWF81600.1 hypothetical protein HUW46_05033 [Amycolatopsis sp. CA-230715]
MSFFDGMSRPFRLGGIVLIGVAVLAAVVGTTVALTGNDSDQNNAAPSPSSSAPPNQASPPPGQPSSPPASSSPPPSSSSATPPPSSPPASPAPGQPGGPPAPGQPGGQPGDTGSNQQVVAKWVTVRVYNNSMIHGLAARAADDLRRQGWNVAEVSGYPSGIIPTTTAFFRPGTDEEAAAKALAASFGMRAEPRFQGIQQSSPGVIVIVTNDYKGSANNKGS